MSEQIENPLLDNLYKEWYKVRPNNLWDLEIWFSPKDITGKKIDSVIEFNILKDDEVEKRQ